MKAKVVLCALMVLCLSLAASAQKAAPTQADNSQAAAHLFGDGSS
jgi:hypothetical protein